MGERGESVEQTLFRSLRDEPTDTEARATLVRALLERGQHELARWVLVEAPDPNAKALRALIERLADLDARPPAPPRLPPAHSACSGLAILVLGSLAALFLGLLAYGLVAYLLGGRGGIP